MFAGDGFCTTNSSMDDDKWRFAQPSMLVSTLLLEPFFEPLFGVQVQMSPILCVTGPWVSFHGVRMAIAGKRLGKDVNLKKTGRLKGLVVKQSML